MKAPDGLIYKVLNYYDPGCVPYGATQQLSCIFKSRHKHQDMSKSARVYSETQTYHCFACGETWDAIGLIMEMEEIGFKDSLKFVRDNFSVNLFSPSSNSSKVLADAYEDAIIGMVVQIKPKNFLSIYKILDECIRTNNAKKIKKLYEKLREKYSSIT